MVESLANGNKIPTNKIDFLISSVSAFKRRSVGRREEIKIQVSGAAVQGQAECQMDPFFVCLKVRNGGVL